MTSCNQYESHLVHNMAMQNAGMKHKTWGVDLCEEGSPRKTVSFNRETCSLLLLRRHCLVSALLWRSQRTLQQAADGAALQQQVQQLQKEEALGLSPFQHTCAHASP